MNRQEFFKMKPLVRSIPFLVERYSVTELQEIFGVSRYYINEVLKEKGMLGTKDLTEHQKAEFRMLVNYYQNGLRLSLREVAIMTGISKSRLQLIAKGKVVRMNRRLITQLTELNKERKKL